MHEPVIQVDDLNFTYDGREPTFSGFDWRVKRGEIWAVIGPSGCGKSTLLYLLAGLLFPTSGSVRIAGRPLSRPRPETGLVLQDHGLLPWATVRENTRLGLKIRKFYGADGRHAPRAPVMEAAAGSRLVDHWLGRLGIGALADQYPLRLSRGQRQRTAIARTMVLKPDLLLLDEPFSALDAPTREDLQHLMVALNRETALTVVIVTHDIEEAATMGEKILALTGASNRRAQIIDNTCTLKAGAREGEGFTRLCVDLKNLLGTLI